MGKSKKKKVACDFANLNTWFKFWYQNNSFGSGKLNCFLLGIKLASRAAFVGFEAAHTYKRGLEALQLAEKTGQNARKDIYRDCYYLFYVPNSCFGHLLVVLWLMSSMCSTGKWAFCSYWLSYLCNVGHTCFAANSSCKYHDVHVEILFMGNWD